MNDNNITINKLSDRINKLVDIIGNLANTVDNLAITVKNEFDNVHNQLKELRQGQENIELKLVNVAYRFELQEVEAKLKHLSERVEALENRSNR